MKRIFAIIAALGTLAACTSESQLPNPDGKGSIWAINGIPGSPFIQFRIEERALATLEYKQAAAPAEYDNFEYNFNFDVAIPGETEQDRIATITLQVEVGREHVFAVTGTLDAPVITTWTTDLREWDEAETVFEARVAHLSATLGEVDVFIQDPADPLVAGGQVARLAAGEIMDFADFEEGTYQVSVTAAGDINTLHFQSSGVTLGARTSNTISLFDGNENDTGPYVAGLMTAAGVSFSLTDPAYLPTARFINAAQTLPAADVYRDEALTDLVATNILWGVPTADVEVTAEETTFYFTPTGSTATTLFSQNVGSIPPGVPSDVFVVGDTDDWNAVALVADRASATTVAKFSIYHGAFNNQTFDVYIKERDAELLEDDFPLVVGLPFGFPSTTLALAAGSYDVYLAELATKNVIGGPYALDVALGVDAPERIQLFPGIELLERQFQHCLDTPAQARVGRVEVSVSGRVGYSPVHGNRGAVP